MKNYSPVSAAASDADAVFDSTKPSDSGTGYHVFSKRVVKVTVFLAAFLVLSAVIYSVASPYRFIPISYELTSSKAKNVHTKTKLESVLEGASMDNRTVILTTLNDAWAEPNSIFDLFLESYRIGEQTKELLPHLVVIALDQKAYNRCIALHPHCYHLESKGDNFTSEAFFMTSSYLHMMWRRIEFLGTILKMGYSFVFTDSDIMWFRNPFERFLEDGDFQIACDYFKGNSYSTNNLPNGGFTYVRSNSRTIRFYKFWYASRIKYPGMHDQDVFNKIKKHPLLEKINLKMRFLDTSYFGGFCQASRSFKEVCTMHANCCVGLDNKVHDLKILLEDWKKYKALPPNATANLHPRWTVPQSCRTSFQRGNPHKNDTKG